MQSVSWLLHTLNLCQALRSHGLNEHIEALESFRCHWLLKLQLFCGRRRRKWARMGKKSLDSVFGAVSKQKPCGVLCEIVHFFLLLFNKDVGREFWRGDWPTSWSFDEMINVHINWNKCDLISTFNETQHCPFTPYLTHFSVTSLQELLWYCKIYLCV